MKTTVFITGTNAVGKTTLARALVTHYGGVKKYSNGVSYCDGGVAFIGKYDGVKFGGVDGLNETRCLSNYIKKASEEAEIIIAEGKLLKNFSLSLQKALFTTERQLVVNLYADIETIYQRLLKRGGGGAKIKLIYNDCIYAMRSAQKWQSIGVSVLQFNTSNIETEDIKKCVIEKIERLRNGIL